MSTRACVDDGFHPDGNYDAKGTRNPERYSLVLWAKEDVVREPDMVNLRVVCEPPGRVSFYIPGVTLPTSSLVPVLPFFLL